jgi:hypothetical protein
MLMAVSHNDLLTFYGFVFEIPYSLLPLEIRLAQHFFYPTASICCWVDNIITGQEMIAANATGWCCLPFLVMILISNNIFPFFEK